MRSDLSAYTSIFDTHISDQLMCNLSLLDVSYEYGTDNDILFNPIKYICTVFKPKGYTLYLPTVFIGQEALKYIAESKYLGFSFIASTCDHCDMLRQMRLLYVVTYI